MATIYQVEIVSDWISYSKEQLEEKLRRILKEEERKLGNVFKVKVKDRKCESLL
jgi:hypothetical protein